MHGYIQDNLKRVSERIEAAALRSGRIPQEIRLVVVTKTVSLNMVKEAIEAGAENIGENYIQEATDKIKGIGKTVKWHFIGHLQRRKARECIELFDLLHSLDSYKLAIELDKRGKEKGKKVRALLQLNLSEEDSKGGVKKEDAIPIALKIMELKNISLEGLMTLPPFLGPEAVRPFFTRLRFLRDKISNETGAPLKELSMGMSNDFEVAIEEGATMLRVGTAIFGPRR
ncbi:MAG: YggS family pyridoxal phosphate-dependent enzyme [Thermodesulfobacteriota bacterium]